MTAKQQQEAFAQPSPSSELAEQVGAKVASRLPDSGSRSARFVWFRDDEALTLLVGEQEHGAVDTALAVGLNERAGLLARSRA